LPPTSWRPVLKVRGASMRATRAEGTAKSLSLIYETRRPEWKCQKRKVFPWTARKGRGEISQQPKTGRHGMGGSKRQAVISQHAVGSKWQATVSQHSSRLNQSACCGKRVRKRQAVISQHSSRAQMKCAVANTLEKGRQWLVSMVF
jgi:hypothetical protein